MGSFFSPSNWILIRKYVNVRMFLNILVVIVYRFILNNEIPLNVGDTLTDMIDGRN